MLEGTIIIGDKVFSAKLALTPREQEFGLMFHDWPPPVMAFPYDSPGVRKFWMKNTKTPLDIVFCLGDEIISIEKGEPLSTLLVGPNSPCDLVVEFPFGTCKSQDIYTGDNIFLKYPE